MQRDDIEYLGSFGAYPIVDRLKCYLSHGTGGVAYARSYKMQRRIEQFSSEAKPDYYFLGHYHVNDHIPQYRNVVCYQLGCFQSQTPHLRRMGVSPEVSGWIINLTINDRGRKNNLASIENKFIPFYKMIERDYK